MTTIQALQKIFKRIIYIKEEEKHNQEIMGNNEYHQK
jgi:hypothetical protein